MSSKSRWEEICELGAGGQGRVVLVRDTEKVASNDQLESNVLAAVRGMSQTADYQGQRKVAFETFRRAIQQIVESDNPPNLGALKNLHDPSDARDPELAGERMKREIQSMSDVSHPNLLRILDSSSDDRWYVSEYHPKLTLDKNGDLFQGDLHAALKALRPLVDAVATLHARNIVHRNIKPQNIFIATDDRLVLGDFGLVYFVDDARTRLSATLENVGSRDWMPQWAFGMRIEDVRPTFDVFGLGKVLWSMVSGKSLLQLWYWDEEPFDLEKLFPQRAFMQHARGILSKCVVEREADCLPDASALLAEMDKTLLIIERNGDILGDHIERYCRVCGIGKYTLASDTEVDNSGYHRPAGGNALKLFTCNHCGHVQTFLIPDRKKRILPAWSEPS